MWLFGPFTLQQINQCYIFNRYTGQEKIKILLNIIKAFKFNTKSQLSLVFTLHVILSKIINIFKNLFHTKLKIHCRDINELVNSNHTYTVIIIIF